MFTYNPFRDAERALSHLAQLRERGLDEGAHDLVGRIEESVKLLQQAALANPVTGYPGVRQRDHDVQTLQNQRNYDRQLHFYVAFLDIDHFGRINKTYGHDKGDAILRATTQILEDSIREYDVLAHGYHLHGEEKQIIFQAPDDTTAQMIANRYRENVKKRSQDMTGIAITESIGVTRWDVDAEEFSLAQERADANLREAKKQRDCVVLGNAFLL